MYKFEFKYKATGFMARRKDNERRFRGNHPEEIFYIHSEIFRSLLSEQDYLNSIIYFEIKHSLSAYTNLKSEITHYYIPSDEIILRKYEILAR